MSSSNKGFGDQLKTALDKFEAVLTPEQKNRLQGIATVPDAPAIIAFTTQLDNENAKRGSRCVATRLLKFLQSIQQFTAVVDTSSPAIAPLVWGSVKFAVLLTSNYASYFDKLSTLFMRFSKYCPRYPEYQLLYADSVGLRVAICNFYAVVINCCTQVVQVISKSVGLGVFWRFFRTDELGRFEKEIQECKSEVDAEIYQALHQTPFQEQQPQFSDRQAAARYFYLRADDKSNDEERKWSIQKDERQARTRKQELWNRLSNYDYMTPYRRASMKRHGQTAGWLTESTKFADWMADPKSSVFVLSGKLGSGKTVTTACTIGHLFDRSSNDYRVAYFFCQSDNAESLSASMILSALVRQLLSIKTISKPIETCLVNLLKVSCAEAQDLGILLKDVLVITKCSFIFIDAIDECSKSEREVLLEVLRDIVISCSGVVKIFLAIRQGIAEDMGKIFKSHYQVTMGSSKANSDIKTYIKDVLAEKKDCGKLVVGNPELINEITDALVQQANGMFLWVAFQIEDICRQVCDYDIHETIQKLPNNLSETYDRILSRIDKMGNAKLAKKIFSWVATARRPMLLEELREALGVEPLQPYSDPKRLISDMSQIVSWCGNLIVLDEQDGTVQFTHPTVKMFLLDSFQGPRNADFHFEHREIENYAGEICVTYLNFNDFETKLIKLPKELPLAWLREHRRYNPNPTNVFTGAALHDDLGAVRELQTEHPFVSYAAKFWLFHSASFERTKTQTWHLWERLLLSGDGLAALPWEYSDWAQRTRTISRWICNQEHVALFAMIQSSETPFAEAEMQCIMDFAIGRPSLNLFDSVLKECHSLTRMLNESLIVAVGGGHLWATDRLLAEKTDPNWRALEPAYTQRGSQDPQLPVTDTNMITKSKKFVGLTALQVASKGGYLEVVDKLLAAKADVNAEAAEYSGRTALQAAAEAGHLEVVERLLAAKADVNAKAAYHSGRTALQAAAGAGHFEVVERLLTAKADVNAEAVEYSGRTALQAAAEAGHLEVVERLLTAKADVNAKAAQNSGRTAVQAAAGAGHLEVVERLLTAKADVNAEAAPDHIRKIFNSDSPVEIEHDHPKDVIQNSSEAEYGEFMEKSSEKRTEIKGDWGSLEALEAFAEATKEGNVKKVELLLKTTEIGRNVEVLKRTLGEVAGQDNEEIMESLLKLAKVGDHPNLPPQLYRVVAREKKEKIAELLLRFTRIGLDSRFIGPIFLNAAREGHAKIVELFLKFTKIGREKTSVLESSIMPPIIPRRRENSDLCIHEARSIARRHEATLAILDTWQLGFEKKQYMSLDALLIDERFGIIPDWFECDWEVLEVLQMNPCYKDHEFTVAKVLRSLVVLTGGRSSFEATVCEKYLTDKWGSIGLDLLDSVASGLDSADLDRECTSAFIDRLSIQPNRISVLCKANILPKEKQALLQALVWLCEAIRVPKPSSKLGISTSSCQVECSSSEFSTLQARDQAESGHACALPTSLKLCFKLQALSHYLTLKDNCWLPLFESGVIAKRSRPEISESEKEDCFHGLEISFDLMVQLAGVEIPVLIDGGVILVGYQTALVPTRMAGTSIQWHLETASESRLNPFELQSTRSNWVKETDWKAFKDLKCFIGWCRSAHINLGTSILTDQVRWSNENSQKRTLRWSGISVGAQAVTSSPLQIGLVGQMTFTFVHNKIMFAPSTVFAKMLKYTSKEVAIVVDCSDQRAWLVPKLSLLLHMSHAWIRRHNIDPNPIPYANAHHVGDSVEQTLRGRGDIALSGQGEDCLRLRQLLLGLNINLIESRQHTEGATRRRHFGFEFMDVVCEPPHGGFMKSALTKTGGSSWYGLSDLADAVVFCAGLGDAITVGIGENGGCTKCNTLPTKSYYLAASLSCLNELITRQGNVLACAQNGEIKISKDHYWKISGNPFKDCTHDDNSSESCWYKTEIFQQVDQRSWLPLFKKNGQSWSSPNIPQEGAVVFGRSAIQG